MRRNRTLFAALAMMLLSALVLVPAAEAQQPLWSHKAIFTFERPFEIPGKILPPGTYVLRLIVPTAHVGQILNTEETEVFGIFFTYTLDRASAGGLGPEVLLEPREKAGKKWDRLVGWFSPGEPVGDRISFDQFKPVEP